MFYGKKYKCMGSGDILIRIQVEAGGGIQERGVEVRGGGGGGGEAAGAVVV